MKRLILLFALLLPSIVTAPCASAQDIYPLEANRWLGFQVDLQAASWHDTVSLVLPDQETILYLTPRILRRGDADSIAVWGSLPDGCVLKVGTAYNLNNFRIIEHGGTLHGPLEYGCHWIPFEVDTNASSPHSQASYIVTTQFEGPGASIDAVELAAHGSLGVRRSIALPQLRTRRYNELGIPDSVHGVIQH